MKGEGEGGEGERETRDRKKGGEGGVKRMGGELGRERRKRDERNGEMGTVVSRLILLEIIRGRGMERGKGETRKLELSISTAFPLMSSSSPVYLSEFQVCGRREGRGKRGVYEDGEG